MRKLIISLMFVLLLSILGTAHASKVYSTDINNVDKKVVIDFMINELLSKGFNLVTVNNYQVIVRKDIDNIMLRALYGSRYNTTPEVRMSLNFIQLDKVVRVGAEARVVTNPNSAFEKSEVIESNETQKMLDRFKNSIEQKYAKNTESSDPSYGFKYATGLIGECVFVSQVIPGSSAEKEGLTFGDKISKINGVTISSIESFTDALKGPAGSRIQITLKLDAGQEKTINLEKH